MGTIARMIDHTELSPVAGPERIDALCAEAIEHGFFSVCVHPVWVARAARALAGGPVAVCTVAGFPLGASVPSAKAREAEKAREAGADEIDMVLSLARFKSGDELWASLEIEGVVTAAGGALVKVILECALLDDAEIERASAIARDAGAAFVKTSTGFGPGGATTHDVRLMRRVVGPDFGVKASGGIRDIGTARAMVEAGASRLGCSASVAIALAETPEG